MDINQSNTTYVKQISLRTNSRVEAVPDVLKWYQDLEFFIFDKTIWWQCQIAVIEAFTNAVRHAHKNLPIDTPIDLEITIFTDRIEMKVWDFGMPFDLVKKLQEIQERESQILAGFEMPLTVADNFS
jgi:serine/threonine-protein kinase RsbW